MVWTVFQGEKYLNNTATESAVSTLSLENVALYLLQINSLHICASRNVRRKVIFTDIDTLIATWNGRSLWKTICYRRAIETGVRSIFLAYAKQNNFYIFRDASDIADGDWETAKKEVARLRDLINKVWRIMSV